jgi:hypothetical protein
VGRLCGVSVLLRLGKWSNGRLRNFQLFFEDNFGICCSAFRLGRDVVKGGTLLETYMAGRDVSLMTWVQEIINMAMSRP